MKPSEGRGLKDCTGKKFGKLTVLEYHPHPDGNGPRWLCKCDCGREYIARADFLKMGRVRSCGCLAGEAQILRDNLAAKNSAYSNYRSSARIRSIPFLLTFEEFMKLTSLPCYYCGHLPSNMVKSSHGSFIYQGIDREDNDIGYTRGNSVPCCFTCNKLKGTMSHREFLGLIIKIYKYSVESVRHIYEN